VAEGVIGLPDLGSLMTGRGVPELPVIGLISVKDANAAETALTGFAARAEAAGMTVVPSEVDGHPTWTLSDGSATDAGGRSATMTLTDDMLVVGMDAADVQESVRLGTQGGANLAGSSAYADAVDDLPDARLATLYVDGTALRMAGGALTSVPGLESALDVIPLSLAGALTVADGTIRFEARAVQPEGAAPLPVGPSALADDVPAATLVYAETHDVGAAIGALLAQLKTQPGVQALGLPIETIEGLFGARLEELFAWVGDVAIAGWSTGGEPGGALVAEVTDAATADARIRQLQALVELAGIGGAVTFTTSTVEGATVTNVSFAADDEPVTVSFTVSDGLFVLGLGESSVRAVLSVTPETALASDAGYEATMSAAGPSTNAGSAYVDLRGLREAAEALIPADQRSRYEAEIRPWLLPFDQIGAVTYQDGTASVASTVITTSQP
jgi:hypothetical protein